MNEQIQQILTRQRAAAVARRRARRDAARQVETEAQRDTHRALIQAIRLAEDSQRDAERIGEDAETNIERARRYASRVADDASRDAERAASDAQIEAERIRMQAQRLLTSSQTQSNQDSRSSSSSRTDTSEGSSGTPVLRSPYPGVTYTKEMKKGGQATGMYIGTFDGKDVVVKVFEKEDIDIYYKNELRALLRMSKHPNIVEVLDFHELPKPALVMILVRGEDLDVVLNRQGRMTCSEVRRIMLEVAEGIAHLHENGIVHLDIKPENIVLDEKRSPIIIDLGLARIQERSQGMRGTKTQNVDEESALPTMLSNSKRIMQTTRCMGTALYMSPEMIVNYEWSSKTDVYSFAIVLWELLSGRTPFFRHEQGSIDIKNVQNRIAFGERPDMSDLPRSVDEDLHQLMKDCWDADPHKRPSIRTVVDRLRGNDPQGIFKTFDVDRSQSLDFAEFVSFLQKHAQGMIPQAGMHIVFRNIGTGEGGNISLEDFKKFYRLVDKLGMKTALETHRDSHGSRSSR